MSIECIESFGKFSLISILKNILTVGKSEKSIQLGSVNPYRSLLRQLFVVQLLCVIVDYKSVKWNVQLFVLSWECDLLIKIKCYLLKSSFWSSRPILIFDLLNFSFSRILVSYSVIFNFYVDIARCENV